MTGSVSSVHTLGFNLDTHFKIFKSKYFAHLVAPDFEEYRNIHRENALQKLIITYVQGSSNSVMALFTNRAGF